MSRRYSIRIAAVTVALLMSAFGAPAPVGAANGAGGCPDPSTPGWTGGSRCTFTAKGFPIVFHGAVKVAPAGSNSIRVWITPRGYPEIVLFECRSSGTRYPSCSGGFPDSSTQLDLLPLPPQIEKPSFDCYVQGTGSGTYFCHSGSTNAP